MSKEAFINELSVKLNRLNEADRKEYLEFFEELIDDIADYFKVKRSELIGA